ncbi:MAG TPA: ComF family protein [Sphingobium sp.]
MTWIARARSVAKPLLGPVLDYALPPRCPACGDIVSASGAFCAPCWQSIDYIADPLCRTCGVELPSQAMGDEAQCGACLADPPPFERARALMRYGEVGRTLAHKLKYSRRVSLARVMAMQMQRILVMPDDADAILVPVPLHRWRIWSRGFNQAALIGRQLSRSTGLPLETGLLRRTKNTPPLHSLAPRARQKAVKGAFSLAPEAKARIAGKTVILIDDIWTTGATASACARMLKSGGAARVEIICWTRAGEAGD